MGIYNCSPTGDKSGFRGCDRNFTTLRYFDIHFIKDHEEDDPDRDVSKVGVDGVRCRTDEELRDIGLDLNDRGLWHDPVITANANFPGEDSH